MIHRSRPWRARRRRPPCRPRSPWSEPDLIRRLERRQRRLEQRATHVADLVRRLRGRRGETTAEV